MATYLITYSDGSSTVSESLTGSAVLSYTTKPASTFSKTGYTLTRWSVATKNNCTTNVSSVVPGGSIGITASSGTANASLRLNPVWTPNKYAVTYYAHGGTGAPAAQTKVHDVTLTLSSTRPTKAGYTFMGWKGAYTTDILNLRDEAPDGNVIAEMPALSPLFVLREWTDPNSVMWYGVIYNGTPGWCRADYVYTATYQPGGSYTLNRAIGLSAIWSPNVTWHVVFHADGTGESGAPAEQTGLGGTSITLSSTKPTKASVYTDYDITYDKVDEDATISKSSESCRRTTAYSFDWWTTNPDGTGTTYTAGSSMTLPVKTAMEAAADPPGTTYVIDLYSHFKSTTSGSVTLPTGTLDQMTLYGWSKQASGVSSVGAPGETYSPTSDVTLYAMWRANGYGGMLKFDYDGDGSEFQVGSKVRLNGIKDSGNEGIYTIAFVQLNQDGTVSLYFEENFEVDGEQNAEELNLEILTDGVYVPDMDYICSLNNRLFGCSSRLRTIYASALGDPTDFYRFQGDSLDSYAVAVGTAGDFTGCCAINNSVYFFKANCIHKLMGNYPAEYAVYTYDTDGVSPGNYASLMVCDSVAIFVTERGIGTYAGAATGSLSRALGEGNMYDAIGGFNGNKYGLFYKDKDGNGHTYAFDTRYGIWMESDYGEVLGWAHLPDEDYMLIKDAEVNGVYKLNTGAPLEGDWEILYRDFYEMATGSYQSQSMIFEKKRYTSITFRVSLPKGSYIEAELKTDDGRWHPAARLSGNENRVVPFKIMTPRCDRLQLKLSGHGPMKIIGLEREFMIGSRR